VTDVFASEQAVQDKQAEIAAAKAAIAGPIPLIEDPPDPTLTLPRGLFHSGTWERQVTVRELTGIDEEALAKSKDPLGYFGTVLALGTVNVGTYDLSGHTIPERSYILNDLLIGEREQLFLKIVQVSFGNERPIGFVCNTCGEAQDVTLLIDSDFPPTEVTDIDKTVFEWVSSKGDVISYRPAIGSDQQEVIERKGATPAEQNTIMISRCVTKVNGELVTDPMGYARGLTMRDRQKLLDLLVARQPQIDLNVKTNCAACGANQTLALGWGDFFRS
jgi:T4 bacteriophage base plate protein